MPYCLRMAAVSIIACGFGRAAAGDVEAVAPGASGVLTKCRGWLVVTSCKTYQHISLPPRIAVRDTITLRFGRPQGLCVSGRADRPEGQHCVIFSEAEGNRQPNGQDRCRSVPSDGRGAPTPAHLQYRNTARRLAKRACTAFENGALLKHQGASGLDRRSYCAPCRGDMAPNSPCVSLLIPSAK